MSFWPFGRRTLTPRVWPARAGTWAAAGGNTGKYTTPGPVPQQAYVNHVSAPIGLDGQVTGTFPSSGVLTLSAGPAGVGASWALDQAGISTSVGPTDSATAQGFAGPQAIESFQVGQSYAAGGDTFGLAGITIVPGEFVWVTWTGGTHNATATLKVTGTKTALAAAS
jgi:plastocyanin